MRGADKHHNLSWNQISCADLGMANGTHGSRILENARLDSFGAHRHPPRAAWTGSKILVKAKRSSPRQLATSPNSHAEPGNAPIG